MRCEVNDVPVRVDQRHYEITRIAAKERERKPGRRVHRDRVDVRTPPPRESKLNRGVVAVTLRQSWVGDLERVKEPRVCQSAGIRHVNVIAHSGPCRSTGPEQPHLVLLKFRGIARDLFVVQVALRGNRKLERQGSLYSTRKHYVGV